MRERKDEQTDWANVCWLPECAAMSQPLLVVRRVIRRSLVRDAELSDRQEDRQKDRWTAVIGFRKCVFVCLRKIGTV